MDGQPQEMIQRPIVSAFPMPIQGVSKDSPDTILQPEFTPFIQGLLPGANAGALEPFPLFQTKSSLSGIFVNDIAAYQQSYGLSHILLFCADGSIQAERVRDDELRIVNTVPLKKGYLTYAYSDKIKVLGGAPPYTIVVFSGALPNGLVLDGVTGDITGTPTVLGDFVFVINAFQGIHEVFRTFSITIAATPAAPVADFAADPVLGEVPFLVRFVPLCTGLIDTYTWNFGDGSAVSNEVSPSHTYESSGLFAVELVVVGAGGTDTENKAGYITADPYWTEKTGMALSPTARTGAVACFDSVRTETLLFGGRTAAGLSNQTLTYNGTTWTLKAPAASPPARAGACLAFDTGRGIAVLFGGKGAAGLLRDIWEWDGVNWVDKTPASSGVASPLAREGAAMAYSLAGAKIYMFGGYVTKGWQWVSDTQKYGLVGGFMGDLWTWDGTTWVLKNGDYKTAPYRRHYAAMVTGVNLGDAILFGGEYANKSAGGHWRYERYNDMFCYHPALDAWYEQKEEVAAGETAAELPLGRKDHGFVADAARKRYYMFGGWSGKRENDLWIYGYNTAFTKEVWRQVFLVGSPKPSRRKGHCLVYDSTRKKLIAFGGDDANGLCNDTWECC